MSIEEGASFILNERTNDQLSRLQGYLGLLGVEVVEGSASSEELAYLQLYAADQRIRRIGEIGFNAGISSCALLEANANAEVISFDIGEHDCVSPAKAFIDREYPGRHILIKGDSTETIPAFHNQNLSVWFDLLFIDGGHAYEVVKADLLNGQLLSKPETTLIIDDLVPWIPYGRGPTRAWEELRQAGVVVQDELVQEGTVVRKLHPPGMRAWARGRYGQKTIPLQDMDTAP